MALGFPSTNQLVGLSIHARRDCGLKPRTADGGCSYSSGIKRLPIVTAIPPGYAVVDAQLGRLWKRRSAPERKLSSPRFFGWGQGLTLTEILAFRTRRKLVDSRQRMGWTYE